MYFDSFGEFLRMGQHGVYVWSAYGIFALSVGLNLLLAWQRERRVRAELARLARREQA